MKAFAALTVAALTIVALPVGCATTGVAQEVRQAPDIGTPDATVHIKGLFCPYCVYNVERSLKNVDGVKRIETDLNTGVALRASSHSTMAKC